ncbi:DUF63 family protein [[Eubacterium] cellulosolvens]
MPEAKKKSDTGKENLVIQKLVAFYSKHILVIWLLIIFVPLIIITIGCILLPEIFYEQFIWRYFWGTIEADAKNETYGEVTEAYNPVNTIVYAFILIAILYWIYKMFKRFGISPDFKFTLAIIPFIIIGGVTRALEDAWLFYAPMVYFFIAPIIYIFIGIVVIGLILLGAKIRSLYQSRGPDFGIQIISWVFVGLNIIYILIYVFSNNQFSYILNPIAPVILSILILWGYIKYLKLQNKFEISPFLFSIGFWFLLICVIILAQWQTIPSWTDAYSNANPNKTIELQPLAFLLVFSLAIFGTFIVYVIAKLLAPKYKQAIAFCAGINLILFFGHFLDASATFIAIDYYGYVEKHVLPVFLIEILDTAAIMYLLKALIIIVVVYFMDILYKKDFQNNPMLAGLVKIAILVLGLGPGLRDVLRLGLGV